MLTSSFVPFSAQSSAARAGPASYLTLHYRIEFLSGPLAGQCFVDTFTDRPATLQMGMGQWADGIESRLVGLTEGDQLEFDLPADEAYGRRNPELVQTLSREFLERHADPEGSFEPGDMVEFVAPNGGRYSGVLKAWTDEGVVFDFNHPLAGHDLRIEVYLLGVL
ncbi:MAG: FKBP-type peptidyl-prolyl cis-trans isomerase [Castellaniella sp.]